MTTKFEIYLGLIDKDTKQQEITTDNAYKICTNICKNCSIQKFMGSYINDNIKVIQEKSFKIELLDKTDDEIRDIAQQLKTTFNQEGVIVNKVLTDNQVIWVGE